MSQTHFDALETRSADEREADLFQRLSGHLQQSVESCPGLAAHLSECSDQIATGIGSREALSALPVLRKPELMAAQALTPPFGGFVDESQLNGTRIFMSPGPVWEPQPPGSDPWSSARALFAAGFRQSDRLHNAFSYHMTPGGFIIEAGAMAMGCAVFPGGVGNTEAQVEAASFYSPVGYIGTPDFLKIMLEKGEEIGKPLTSIKRALVSGGALFPSMRQDYSDRGVTVLQCYATADLGVIAYESHADNQLVDGMVCSEDLIVEICRPGTSDPLPAGEVGELVVTNFNAAYPLVRFGTGDLSCVLEGESPCGRTNLRLKGWMGRADQRTKVKGMFVDPGQVDVLSRTQQSIEKLRLVVSRDGNQDKLEVLAIGKGIDTDALADSTKQVLKLSGIVEIVDTLPNDGLVIADQRDYSEG